MNVPTEFNLWLVRHPRPEISAGLCYGRTDLVANQAHTHACAQALRAALTGNRDNLTFPDMPIWTSPLKRCMQLAQALLDPLPSLPPAHIDTRLAEMDFGHWEGLPWTDIPATEFEAWMADFPHHCPGDGENVSSLMARTHAVWHDTLTMSLQQGKQAAMWITHAGIIRAMTLLHAGCSLPASADQWPASAPAFGEWTVLHFVLPVTAPYDAG